MSDVRPEWEEGVPHCTREDCPSYDGKRCKRTGFRPDGICEPAVIAMAAVVERARGLSAPNWCHLDAALRDLEKMR